MDMEKPSVLRWPPGQAHELPLAPAMLDSLPAIPLWVVGDKGYASNAMRERI